MLFIDSFQEKIWKDKYQYGDETYEDFCHRIAYTIFAKDEHKAKQLKESIEGFRTLFGGRINSNIGIPEQGLTLFNCFIEATVKDPDSLEGIMDMVTKYALTLKTEGGVGFCANFLRPANTLIRKIGVTTPGAIKFLEIFDKVSEVITSGSVSKKDSIQGVPTKKSIRKGATMVTMSANHPDIEDFITAKSIPNKLTKMNMSVLISDAFMYAVDNELDWNLWFPDISHDKYDKEWDGDFEKWAGKGYPCVTYKTVKANYLWELLLKSSYCVPGTLELPAYHNNNPTDISITHLHKMVQNGEDIQVLSINKDTLKLEKKRVTNSVCTGENELLNITTSSNLQYKCTGEHKLFGMSTGAPLYETMAKDFVVDDYIATVNKTTVEDENFCVDDDWEVFTGMILGDGSVRHGQIRIAVHIDQVEEVLPLANRIAERYNREVKLYYDKRSNNWAELSIHSTKLSTDLEAFMYQSKFEGQSTSIKEIPNYLFTTINLRSVRNFLSGFFSADGCINGQKTTYYSKHDHIAIGIQRLLLRVGVISRKYKVNHKELKVFGFRVDMDMNNSVKLLKEIPKFLIESKVNRDFYETVNEYKAPIGIMAYDEIKSFSNKAKLHRENRRTGKQNFPEKYQHLFDSNVVHESIVDISSGGTVKTYDITVEDNENFICVDGGLYHNCRNEPGILFIDTIRSMDNIKYLTSSIQASNPCGEVMGNTGIVEHKGQLFELGDVCNLGSLVLPYYYDMSTEKFNFEEFKKDITIMVEALDNVIEISDYPLDMYEQAAKMKRKIGLGVAGIGSLFMMMGVKYGSDESIKITEEILSILANTSYQASALLAKEKGPFPLYDEKLLEDGYVKNGGVLTEDTLAIVKKHGLRHSATMAIAPNGTLSILAGNVSGGLEPVFSPEFTRWNRIEGKKLGFTYPKIHKGEWFETDYFKEELIADEPILVSTDGKYRIDNNQGLCKEVTIRDYGYNQALEYGKIEFTTAMGLSVQEHFNILSVFAKYIDLSCSKTVNLPADITFEDFKALYGKIHSQGIKGCTTYRAGTSIAVLEVKKEEKDRTIKAQQKEFLEAFRGHENGDIMRDVVKLPEEYPSMGYVIRAEKKKWYLHVAFKNEAKTKPFAIFVSTNDQSPTLITNNAIEALEKLARKHRLGGRRLEEVGKKYARQPNSVKVARMLGYLLRHNVPMLDIVKALDNVEDAHVGTFVFRIKKFLMQFITEPVDLGITCNECGGVDVILQEGCTLCRSCGSSKCS